MRSALGRRGAGSRCGSRPGRGLGVVVSVCNELRRSTSDRLRCVLGPFPDGSACDRAISTTLRFHVVGASDATTHSIARRPKPMVAVGCGMRRVAQPQQSGLGDADLTPPVAVSRTAAEWVWTWVSTPMTTSTTSHRSVRLVMRSLLRRTGRGSGPGRRLGRTVMRHARRGLTPGGQAPDQASSSNRAGAGNHERTSRSKARSQSHRGSHPRSPTTAHHHQAAQAILTVTPPTLTRVETASRPAKGRQRANQERAGAWRR